MSCNRERSSEARLSKVEVVSIPPGRARAVRAPCQVAAEARGVLGWRKGYWRTASGPRLGWKSVRVVREGVKVEFSQERPAMAMVGFVDIFLRSS